MSGFNVVLLLFVFFVLNLMVFINLFDLVELMCVVLLEFVVGIDDIFVVICDVKGVNVESGEKLLVKGLFFIFFVVECGFVG